MSTCGTQRVRPAEQPWHPRNRPPFREVWARARESAPPLAAAVGQAVDEGPAKLPQHPRQPQHPGAMTAASEAATASQW